MQKNITAKGGMVDLVSMRETLLKKLPNTHYIGFRNAESDYGYLLEMAIADESVTHVEHVFRNGKHRVYLVTKLNDGLKVYDESDENMDVAVLRVFLQWKGLA